MGKVDHNIVEPFAALFGALGIVQYLPTPDPVCHHSTDVHKACPYMVIVVSILNEDAPPPPPFSYLGILFIYGPGV